jgi:hypothetical protein
MQNAESLSRAQMREFLESSRAIEFTGCGRDEQYGWVERVLGAQQYGELGKRDRGLVRAYLEKVTGLSGSQMTRLIRAFLDTGKVQPAPYQRHQFAVRYTDQDIALLAEVDRVHERLSGPATRRILEREYQQFGQTQYARLAGISVAHVAFGAAPGRRDDGDVSELHSVGKCAGRGAGACLLHPHGSFLISPLARAHLHFMAGGDEGVTERPAHIAGSEYADLHGISLRRT